MAIMFKKIAVLVAKALTLTSVGTLVSAGACEYGDLDPNYLTDPINEEIAEYNKLVEACCNESIDQSKCKDRYDNDNYCEADCCKNSADAEQCKRNLEDNGVCETAKET